MQVGDLVRHRNHPIWAIVLEIRDNEVYCLWNDGDVCWVIDWLVYVAPWR